MSILVTGGAGFIGSHLIERLLEETSAQIVCLDNLNDFYSPVLKRANLRAFEDHPRVTVVAGDFCDSKAMERLFEQHDVDHVVHLGAHAGVRRSIEQPFDYQRNNVFGTLALLEAARIHGVSRFLLISSSTVYGAGAESPFREDAPLGIPTSPYGATKRAAEVLGLTYWQLHKVPVVCLRLFSVYGPRLRPDLAMTVFANAMLRGAELPLFGDGSVRRDFTHVSDICRGFIAALTAEGIVGQAVNLGHNAPIAVRQMIAMLEDALGKKAKIKFLPANPSDMALTHADLTKAGKLLGYAPRVPFSEGIVEFANWCRHRYGTDAGAPVGIGANGTPAIKSNKPVRNT